MNSTSDENRADGPSPAGSATATSGTGGDDTSQRPPSNTATAVRSVPSRHWAPAPFALLRHLKALGLHLADLPVLLVALGRAGRDRTFFTSTARWANDAGVSERGLSKSLARLKGRFLRVVDTGRHGHAATYSVEPLDHIVATLETRGPTRAERSVTDVQGSAFGERRAGEGCTSFTDGLPGKATNGEQGSPQQTPKEGKTPEQTPGGGPRLGDVGSMEEASTEGVLRTPDASSGSDGSTTSARCPDDRVERFMEVYAGLLHQLRGVSRPVIGDKDRAVLLSFIVGRPDAEIMMVLERFVRDDDQFLVKVGWQLRLLELRANRYLATTRDTSTARRGSYSDTAWADASPGDASLE
ncbi:MAG: hypothetical protein HY905_15740 [Deltaproteobacteria bacterium]|nr:hypothetical protein [Deltaproteobacteria bacterium]